ncbi:MAG: DUF4926 domain-containing protein [Candidatus Kapabacteria bacterium]|nr:DUF4926 domain-containing protein [Candidatus Kapabacteria bacterium]
MKHELYTEVVFLQDIDELSIKKGDIGTLVEYYPANEITPFNGYSVEIFDAYGDTVQVVTVDENKISKIKHNSVLSVREVVFS